MDISHLLFSFEGRINRAKWWLGVLILWVISMILYGIAFALGFLTVDVSALEGGGGEFAAFAPLYVAIGIIWLVTLYPMLALYAKRWHDRNKSGWWSLMLIGALIPFLGIVFAIWLLVELGILKGTDGPNNYGPDPLQ